MSTNAWSEKSNCSLSDDIFYIFIFVLKSSSGIDVRGVYSDMQIKSARGVEKKKYMVP